MLNQNDMCTHLHIDQDDFKSKLEHAFEDVNKELKVYRCLEALRQACILTEYVK